MTDYRHNGAFLPNDERDPYYPLPILPDAIHCGPIHKCCPPRPRTVTIEENNKVAEIRDAFKNLRFKVSLTSFDSYDFPGAKKYLIQVISYNGYNPPLIIVDIPKFGELPIFDYDKALKIYEDYVKVYSQLIKAETKDFQDIELYKEQIGYKMTKPKCCFTCKWCKKHPFDVQFKLGEVGKLECFNPKCCQAYKFDSTHRHSPWNEHCHDPRMHEPNCYDYDKMCIDIHPNVDMFGICDNYEEMKEEFRPMPQQNIGELINMKVDNRIDVVVPPVVSTLVPPIVSALVSTEYIVGTVSVALATDLLSAPFLSATATTFKQPEISNIIIDPINNVLPTPTLSTTIVNIAAAGITVDEIIGNNGLEKMLDLNKNNIPDEYEEDTMILGDLGA